MAMNASTRGHPLPCGRDLEGVWEHLDAPDGHERGCPDCRAARADLLVLRTATAELVEEDLRPPPGLTGRIMGAVRADLRRRDLVALPATAPDTARISTRAAAAVLRSAVDAVDGVRARHCGVAERADGVVEVDLHVAVSPGHLSPAALDAARDRVVAAAGARIGWAAVKLDLTVVDLLDP
ncbi:hypothetical protein [Actinokineospora bangkokensis]|uniref:Asp23/Gls24 family envelope stress response protein n=1 Tax=Actinokineospora bangkokensis TaxID=1193682 RepID=A0A1Q9LMM2_9PSEU|nr:hypothetical protein [Actinokineospora bangkokensis]OLR93280.1 hypothetical protein BJP25_17515 [Actinokineospora bangkokensis]